MKKLDWKDYFSFSKKERKAAIAIVLVTGAVTFAGIAIQAKDEDQFVTTKFDQALNDSVAALGQKDAAQDTARPFIKNEINENDLFVFDPNTLDEAGWKRLGLNERIIHTIVNYRNKGGRFYKPEDIQKIYGIGEANAKRLTPYVRIAGNKKTLAADNHYQKENAPPYPKKQYKIIDINKATEDDWKSLPGIGDVLSKRIVKFRTSRGGFQSIDDVGRTYGLKDSVFQMIRPYLRLASAEE